MVLLIRDKDFVFGEEMRFAQKSAFWLFFFLSLSLFFLNFVDVYDFFSVNENVRIQAFNFFFWNIMLIGVYGMPCLLGSFSLDLFAFFFDHSLVNFFGGLRIILLDFLSRFPFDLFMPLFYGFNVNFDFLSLSLIWLTGCLLYVVFCLIGLNFLFSKTHYLASHYLVIIFIIFNYFFWHFRHLIFFGFMFSLKLSLAPLVLLITIYGSRFGAKVQAFL